MLHKIKYHSLRNNFCTKKKELNVLTMEQNVVFVSLHLGKMMNGDQWIYYFKRVQK